MNISKQKGTKDIFFDDVLIWQYIESKIFDICSSHNVHEIRIPIFEATNLYSRSVGDQTDIVNKEMYTFDDKGGRSITLRPEFTAGVVRAYIENGMSSYTQPVKLWYSGNAYRYEKMQKGRYREFSQFGVEIFGANSYMADIETILVSYELFKALQMDSDIMLNINSIGCKDCRSKYIEKLREFLKPHITNMCDTCKVRYDKNILRMFDCKNDTCKAILKDAPMITDYLCDECSTDFNNIKECLNKLNIPFEVDKTLVRGLDYYNKTVYEYVSKKLDLSVGGGGRYDELVSLLGGTQVEAVGFALGMDRIVLLMKDSPLVLDLNKNVDIYFLTSSENSRLLALNLATELRNSNYNFKVETDISDRSFKAQLKYANNINANYVCILGDELNESDCVIKNMTTGEQQKVDISVEAIEKYIVNN